MAYRSDYCRHGRCVGIRQWGREREKSVEERFWSVAGGDWETRKSRRVAWLASLQFSLWRVQGRVGSMLVLRNCASSDISPNYGGNYRRHVSSRDPASSSRPVPSFNIVRYFHVPSRCLLRYTKNLIFAWHGFCRKVSDLSASLHDIRVIRYSRKVPLFQSFLTIYYCYLACCYRHNLLPHRAQRFSYTALTGYRLIYRKVSDKLH